MAAKKPPKRAWLHWDGVYEGFDVFTSKRAATNYMRDDDDRVFGPYVLETRPKRKARRRTDGSSQRK